MVWGYNGITMKRNCTFHSPVVVNAKRVGVKSEALPGSALDLH